jgi:diguanylate cyclase (GGDEF)-like protein/PAS domain S-box-containing protein/putative nucleotidyltransferase with HDIG domain
MLPTMFGLRSVQGRMAAVLVLFVLLLVGVSVVAVWRTQDLQQRHRTLERTSTATTALQGAQTQFWWKQAALSALVFSSDPGTVADYHNAAAAVDQHLSQARAEAVAAGKADYVANLDDLSGRIGDFNEEVGLALPVLLEASPETAVQLATAAMSDMVPEADAITAQLEDLVREGQEELAAQRAASDQAADTTLWLLMGFGTAAFLVAAGTAGMLLVSVIRPMASLRATARAITSGDLESRAEVSGPREVASLARAFNEMTDALAAKTQEYVDTTNLTGDMIVRLDKDGRFTFLNDGACQAFGRSRETLLGTDAGAFLHPEDLEPATRTVEKVIENKGLVKGVVGRLITPMGTKVLEWNGCPFFDEEGQYAGIQITGRDITERRQMEKALSATMEEYVATTNLTGDIIAKVDEEGRWVFLNDAACQFYGKQREELLGADSKASVHPEDLERTVHAVRESAATREPVRGFVNRQVTPVGTRVLEWNACPLFDGEDRYIGIQMTGRDITERERAEEALRESEERFRSLSASAPIGIFLTGPRGNCIYANPRLQAIAGLTLEESLGDGWTKVIHPDDRQAVMDEVSKTARQGRDFSREFRILTPEGELHWIHVHTSPMFSPQSKQEGSVGTVEDITERRQADKVLRESEERLRTLVTNAPVILFAVDREGIFTLSEGKALESLGLRPGEVVGRSVLEVYGDTPQITQYLQRALAGEEFTETVEVAGLAFETHYTPVRDHDGEISGGIGVAMDITERERAEEALSAKTKEYIDTTNLTGDIIAKLDRRGNWVFLNDAACRFYGKPREELLGTDSRALVHLEDLEATAEAIRDTRARKELVTGFVNRQVTSKGTRVVEWDGYPLFDEEGQYAGIQITGHDITERKRMEEALRESEARYRLLGENASDIIWTTDLNLRYTYISPSVTRMRGYSVEEVTSGTLKDSMTPASLEVAQKALAEELALEKKGQKDLHRSRTLELELNCKDGSTIWTEVQVTFLRDPDGQAIGLMGVTRDITERKRMEQALRQSEARYRLLAENASDLIWTMDLGLRYTYMSPAVKHMRGYTVEEIMAQTVNESMTPASREVAIKTLAEELAMERMEDKDITRTRKLDLEMYCKDGSTIWTEMHMKFLRDADGNPIGIQGTTRDISERKRAEEEREGLHAELELRAITDSLTGLYDHAHFYQRLAEEIERSKRYKHGFALLMMDIDDFKRFNDSRGHKVGDEMLRLVARCIPAGLRRSDLAFRYGGDEFAAILPHADSSKAGAAVDRMNGRIARRLKQMDGDAAGRLSLTAGVACFPNDGTTADELVRIADAALYNAKWVARARDIMGQREDIQSLVSALVSRQGGAEGSAGGAAFRPEALHEQQARIVSSVASSITVALKDAGVAQALEDPDLQVLATVGAAAEIKDRYIRGHPERMSEQAAALAEEMGLSPERVRDIKVSALLHDIGKVTVSEGILNKPGKLTRREFDSIKDHPIVGATLVSQVKGFERLVPIVRHHHERFDGTGYPDGLAGEDIPPESRILSVLDVFDALTHQRSYRKAQSKEEALAEIERGAGTQFDPVVAKAFLALVRRRGDGLRALARAASEDRPLATARAAGRRKR